MRWDPGHRSSEVIDRRGQGGGSGLMAILLLVLRSRFGWAGVVVAVVGWGIWQWAGGLQQAGVIGGSGDQGTEDQAAFVGFVLDDVQATWERKSPIAGVEYRRAKLVLFTGSTATACGYGQAATGPFYCPTDQQVYIDLSFYDELRQRLGAPGDFAQAYVIGHEIGHHVQSLLGTSDQVHRAARSEQRGADGMSVRLELQADCYSGVWAHDAERRGLLEVGDIDEALQAAAAIGDDRLQRSSRGTVSPESFSHGTSAQRAHWFQRGFRNGDPTECDTFSAAL